MCDVIARSFDQTDFIRKNCFSAASNGCLQGMVNVVNKNEDFPIIISGPYQYLGDKDEYVCDYSVIIKAIFTKIKGQFYALWLKQSFHDGFFWG